MSQNTTPPGNKPLSAAEQLAAENNAQWRQLFASKPRAPAPVVAKEPVSKPAPSLPYSFESEGRLESFATIDARTEAALAEAVRLAMNTAILTESSDPLSVHPPRFQFLDGKEDAGCHDMTLYPQYWEQLKVAIADKVENPTRELQEAGFVASSAMEAHSLAMLNTKPLPDALRFTKTCETDNRLGWDLVIKSERAGITVWIEPSLTLPEGGRGPGALLEMSSEVRYPPARMAEFHTKSAAVAEALRESFVLADRQQDFAIKFLAERDERSQAPPLAMGKPRRIGSDSAGYQQKLYPVDGDRKAILDKGVLVQAETARALENKVLAVGGWLLKEPNRSLAEVVRLVEGRGDRTAKGTGLGD